MLAVAAHQENPGTLLRIAVLAESCAAGVGRHVIDLAESLGHAGHEVHLLYSRQHMDAAFRSGLERVRSQGAQTLALDLHHEPHPADINSIAQIRRHLREHGPFEILHCHSTKAGLLGRLAAIGTGCRSVYTPHAFLTMSPVAGRARKLAARAIEWTLARLGDCVICVSEEEESHAVAIGISPNKLHVVSNGIDLNQSQSFCSERGLLRRKWKLANNTLCIGFVGRLAPQKAPELLLQSYARLRQYAQRDTRLVIVGDGPLRGCCESEVERLGLREHVIFENETPGARAMAGFDLFALPSRYEGFPYVLLEALAAGLPIVASAVGGTSKLINSGVNGFRTAIGNQVDFAVALERVVNDASLRRHMSDASAALAKEFSLERMHLQTVAVYRSVLEREMLGSPVLESST